MRIHANINERTVRRKFTEPKHRKRPLTIIDHTLPAFSLRIVADDTRTFFVRVKRWNGRPLPTASKCAMLVVSPTPTEGDGMNEV